MDMTIQKWRKSSYTASNGSNCVEVVRLAGDIGIRDSKSRERGHLIMPLAQFTALLSQLKQQSPAA